MAETVQKIQGYIGSKLASMPAVRQYKLIVASSVVLAVGLLLAVTQSEISGSLGPAVDDPATVAAFPGVSTARTWSTWLAVGGGLAAAVGAVGVIAWGVSKWKAKSQ